MWKLFQGAIVFAVFASDIHWQWSTSGYVTAILAFFAAFAATVFLTKAIELARWARIRFNQRARARIEH